MTIEDACYEYVTNQPFLGALATHPPLDARIRAIADTLDCPIPPFVEITES